MDALLLSRLQFALTTIVHIVFPVLSMGLAPFLVYFTWKEVRTNDVVWERLRRFWLRVFAVSFVVGTVTGLVLEFEFGTNWGAFSRVAGAVIGGPLATEGMLAFFLEATFLGIFLFGRERVSDRVYLLAGFLTGLGAWLSATWILVVNSWMQAPTGVSVSGQGQNLQVTLTNPIAAYANPRFPWEFVHMQNASVLSVALLLAGVAAYHIWRSDGGNERFWKTTLKVALVVMLITAPLQVIHGDAYARHVAHNQPEKFAAMEAVWDTASHVPEFLVAFPTNLDQLLNPRAQDLFGIGIPGGASWLYSGGNAAAQITGLHEFGETPPVAFVFWSFRVMVALGMWFILLAFWGCFRWWRGGLYDDKLLHEALTVSSVLGFIAVELGWVVTEVGRQPWIIQGIMKTSQAVTPGLTTTEAAISFAGFVGGYVLLLVVAVYVLSRIVRAGPPEIAAPTPPSGDGDAPEGVAGDD